MTRAHDFAVDLAKAGMDAKDIQELIQKVHGNALSLRQVYRIVKMVKTNEDPSDKRMFNAKKTVRTPDFIESVQAQIEADRRISIKMLACNMECSVGTISNTIHNDLGFVKKSARWVPKLLSDDQKNERVRLMKLFVKNVDMNGKDWLRKIVTMDESAVSLHTPETKAQSKQWLPKGSPGPIKARVHASRENVMVLAFFDGDGMIYERFVAKGIKVNGDYIVDTLKRFKRAYSRKRPHNDITFHWDNAPVHKASVVEKFTLKNGFTMIPHPPYSPDLAPADFFLFPKVKSALAGVSMKRNSVQFNWDRVVRNITKDEFTEAYNKWYHRAKKCVDINGDYVEKMC